ncbi:MAG: gamma-glutamyl-gamma-aminobutyrate hydrolase family protein [Demequinaceae bacterium]|nr:gamma-glutamyl-gamma-aminobutyrate hydrolase family protein [Demequinaceae bacterium]
MSARRPVIGVTSYLERATMGVWDVPAVFLPTSYARPIAAAGASIVVLPPQETHPDAVSRILDGLDGLCVAGGYDVAPAAYGHSPHSQTDAPRTDRDAWEFAILEAALARDMPVLGVCRGAQVLNVLRGGTLHQHLPDVVDSSKHQGENGIFGRIPVSITAGTLLATVHPLKGDVPVYHHQAIDTLGAGLVVSATCEDGIVEAVEDPSLTFCVAVQWHPEQDEGAAGLYEGFVGAARAYRA